MSANDPKQTCLKLSTKGSRYFSLAGSFATGGMIWRDVGLRNGVRILAKGVRRSTKILLLAASDAPRPRRTTMAKANIITETAWTGPVHIVPLGWGLTATFVVLFALCFVAALLFPNAELTHNWLSLYSTRPLGSLGQWIEGSTWNVVCAWHPA